MRKKLLGLEKKFRLLFSEFYTWLLRETLGECGVGVRIEYPVRLEHPENITIGSGTHIYPRTWLNCVCGWAGETYNGKLHLGRDVKIGYNVQISAALEITLEDGAAIGSGTVIMDHIHDYRYRDIPIFEAPLAKLAAVRIGKGSFLGVHCFVGPGVEIGEHAIVSANAVVLRDVPAYSIVAGNPARAVRYTNLESTGVPEPTVIGVSNA